MILRARLVVPVGGAPIENGAVVLAAGRIEWVGPFGELPPGRGGEALDMGDCALLPGLVNAHCHLDYTGMAGQFEPPRRFSDWLKSIVALKGSWSVAEFAASWEAGAAMLLRTGTTTVADVEAVPELLPARWGRTPLRVFSFRELISIRSQGLEPELVAEAERQCLGWGGAPGQAGLSPHAPYTTNARLLDEAAQAAHRHQWRLVTHVAESEEESEMYLYRQGGLYEWLKGQRDMSDCGLGTPVEYLDRCGYLDRNVLAVHANYLGQRDAALLAGSGASVVHCPRSHQFFRHLRFPLDDLASAGVNLCLGTDSLASVRRAGGAMPELDLFAEMQTLAQARPDLRPADILAMATRHGARALGLEGELGEISPGARADLIAVPLPAAGDPLEAMVYRSGPVTASMIGGEWAVPPPR
ncbi:MAG: hypothetical protein RJA22_239 [Verrucomicrobiota bacterium]